MSPAHYSREMQLERISVVPGTSKHRFIHKVSGAFMTCHDSRDDYPASLIGLVVHKYTWIQFTPRSIILSVYTCLLPVT